MIGSMLAIAMISYLATRTKGKVADAGYLAIYLVS